MDTGIHWETYWYKPNKVRTKRGIYSSITYVRIPKS